MKCLAATVCLLAAAATAAKIGSEGPVSKVVHLLEDLKSKLEEDGEVDEKDFKEHECWCSKVEVSKQEMIEEGKNRVEKSKSAIAEGEAKDDAIELEHEQTVEDLHENEDAQASGNSTRNKDHSENVEEIEDDTQLKVDIRAAEDALLGGEAGAEANETSFAQVASKTQRYSPKVQTIRGILTNQYEKTDQEVQRVTKEEKAASENFDGWMTDMKEQLGLLEEKDEQEVADEAEVEVEIAEDTETKEDTLAQIAADTSFLKEAEESCAARKSEYLNRTTLREIEMGGVNKALEILESQRELLSKTFKTVELPSFLQLSSETSAAASATAALKASAAKAQSLRLALLASHAEEALPDGAFTTVLAEIAQMMDKLKAEAETDKKKKDFCKSEYHTIVKKSKKFAFLIQKSTSEIGKLESRLAQLAEEKAAAEAEVSETDADLTKSKDLRAGENQEFLKAKADDELAIGVLKSTSDALNKYYQEHLDDKAAGALIQYDPNALSDKRDTLRKEENKYTLTGDDARQPAANMILALLNRLTDNLQKEIDDSREYEQKAQLDYEKGRDLLLAGKEKLVKKITSIDGMVSNAEGSKLDTETAKSSSEGDLKAQEDYKASIQAECDWLLEKFDERVVNRESEMDGLTRAKELLSGSSLVQKEAHAHKPEKADEDKSSLMNYLGFSELQ